MRAHALHRERHFRRIVLGKDRTLQAMTIETPQHGHFLRRGARRALHPLAVRHLQGENVRRGLRKVEVELRGAARFDRCRCRLEHVPDRAHGDVISAGGEPVLRKTVLPLRVGADRNHDGGARALGADYNAFHFSFLREDSCRSAPPGRGFEPSPDGSLRSAKPAGPCSSLRRRTIS